jgi:hypothetical protein
MYPFAELPMRERERIMATDFVPVPFSTKLKNRAC